MQPIRVVNLAEKFSSFHECWSPRIAGEINDSYVKLAKLSGEFIWHKHENEDEMFLVVKGVLRMKIREEGSERELSIGPGEYVIIPKGMEHLPIADEEAHVVLLEPKSTLNTGDVVNERTRAELQRI
ncbi:MAG TPA: cupin domain-containing protein [Terriglobales bacterium]